MNSEPTKEIRRWNGIPLNITTKTGEPRFSFSPPMTCDYGCIRGTWGAGLDGKALDVYVVSDVPTVFKVLQITPAGAIDEYKYILGARNFDEAVETFLKHAPKQLFGAASQYSIGQLQNDIAQQSKVKRDADEVAEFVEQLEELIESDDAYSSSVYVLSFEVAGDGDITGKFQDVWNKRIFSYSVEKNRMGYKPALTLDRADSTAAKLFDIFSSGYRSLQVRQDAMKNGKKPRCTAVSYNCGKICLSLQNTCWINSSGQKVKKAGGAVASISQGRIDKLRTLARYLAANGNNKWSKYGSAEYLAAKASNLEAKRTNLFAATKTKQTLTTNSTKTTQNLANELNTVLIARDFKKLVELTKQIQDLADNLPTTKANQGDKLLAVLAQQKGFDGIPQSVSQSTVDEAWNEGGLLLGRGTGRTENKGIDGFEKDEYYVGGTGGTLYGSGTYWWHGGDVKRDDKKGLLKGSNSTEKAKEMYIMGASSNYVRKEEDTLRAVLPKDSKIVTQAELMEEGNSLNSDIDIWAEKERQKILKDPAKNQRRFKDLEEQFPGITKNSEERERKLKSELTVEEYKGSNQHISYIVKNSDGTIKERLTSNNYTKRSNLGSNHTATPLGYKASDPNISKKDFKKVNTELILNDYAKITSVKEELIAQLSKSYDLNKIQFNENDGDLFFPSKDENASGYKTGTTATSRGMGFKNKFIIRDKDYSTEFEDKDKNNPNISHDFHDVEMRRKTSEIFEVDPSQVKSYERNLQDAIFEQIAKKAIANSNPIAIKEINNQAEQLKKVWIDDIWNKHSDEHNRNFSRLATARGYDGVMLNQSYAPESMFVLYNRSKVLTQKGGLTVEQHNSGSF